MKRIDCLKNEVIEAFIAHETGKELKYTNSQYDKMLAEVKAEDPNFNVFEYLPIPEGAEVGEHRSGLIWLEKYSPANNDIVQYWNDEEGKVKTPKYDGSDIIVYYTNGKLSHILSMSDKSSGVVQTDKFRNMVPQNVKNNVSFIRCEVLVDVRKYENARGKANGLVNSKYLQDEVDELATIVGLHVVNIDGDVMSWEDTKNLNLPIIYRETSAIPKFLLSPECKDIELVDRGIAHYISDDGKINFKFCIDGIVYTEDKDWNCPWCYKYDYLYPAETEVLDISWRETNGEGLTPVLVVDPVEVDHKMIYGPSTNGVPSLLELKCGVGSIVQVAFSKLTIPQVVGVTKEAEVKLPVCKCGHQFTTDDIRGALIKCPDPKCSRKLELRQQWMDNYLADKEIDLSDKEYILHWFEWFIFTFLNIARFNYESKRWNEFDTFSQDLLECIKNEDVDKFEEVIKNNYSMSWLMRDDLHSHAYSTVKILNKYLK